MPKPQFNPSPDTAPRPREPHPDGFGKQFIFKGRREHSTTEAFARLLLHKNYEKVERIRTMRLTRLAREKAEKESVAPAPDPIVHAPAPDIAEVQPAETEHRASVPQGGSGQPPASSRVHGAGLDSGRALLEALSTTAIVENLNKDAEPAPAGPATAQSASRTGSLASGQSKKSVSFANAKADATNVPEDTKSDGKANSRANSSASMADAVIPDGSSRPPSLKGILRPPTPPPVPPKSPLNPPSLRETQVRPVFIPQPNFHPLAVFPSYFPYLSHSQSNNPTSSRNDATRFPQPPVTLTIGGRNQTYTFNIPKASATATAPLNHSNRHAPSHSLDYTHTHTQQHNHHNHAPQNYHHQPSRPTPSEDSNTLPCTGCSCLYLDPNTLDHEGHMICCKCHKSIEQHIL